MMNEDKILWVARYAEGDMEEVERADFELRLQTDPELQQYLNNYNGIHDSLKMQLAPDLNDKAFKASLKDIGAPYFAAPKVVSFKATVKWLSAVAAVLIIGLLVWAPWRSNLYDTYHTDTQMLVAERGAEKATALDSAATFFNDKKYGQAKPLLASLALQQPANAMVNYYYGLTLIETNDLAMSRQVLEKLYHGDSAFKYDAAYAMAMSYLKAGQKDECRNWLHKIPQGTTNYQKATALLDKL